LEQGRRLPIALRLALRQSVSPCLRDYVPQYLQYLLMDFRHTFVSGVSWVGVKVVRIVGQRVKGQASSSRRYSPVQFSS